MRLNDAKPHGIQKYRYGSPDVYQEYLKRTEWRDLRRRLVAIRVTGGTNWKVNFASVKKMPYGCGLFNDFDEHEARPRVRLGDSRRRFRSGSGLVSVRGADPKQQFCYQALAAPPVYTNQHRNVDLEAPTLAG
jgi:hypothetical protein